MVTNKVNKYVLWLQVLVAYKASLRAVIERMNNLTGNADEFGAPHGTFRNHVAKGRVPFSGEKKWDPVHQFNVEKPLDRGMMANCMRVV